MSATLFIVLIVLMAANQIIGTTYGTWKKGFNKPLFCSGLLKIAQLAVGYGALALAAHFASQYVPAAEYLNGILVEPIARYFSKICESLRLLLSESATEIAKRKMEEKQVQAKESLVPEKISDEETTAVHK